MYDFPDLTPLFYAALGAFATLVTVGVLGIVSIFVTVPAWLFVCGPFAAFAIGFIAAWWAIPK